MTVQQRIRFWLSLLLFFFFSKLGNSEIITSNHNTTQLKWNIWLLNHQHSTEGTGDCFSDRTQTRLWRHGVRGNLRYSISRIMCSIRLKRQCVTSKAAFGRSNRCSTYCTWSSKYTRMVCDRKKHTATYNLYFKFLFKKKKKKIWERKAKREYNANFLRQPNRADTDSQVISASKFKRHC